jgi:cytochrome c oxidase subunit 1
MSIKKGKVVPENPWQATTLEWTSMPSPPIAHGNFVHQPSAYRGPYEYSAPESTKGFIGQDER